MVDAKLSDQKTDTGTPKKEPNQSTRAQKLGVSRQAISKALTSVPQTCRKT